MNAWRKFLGVATSLWLGGVWPRAAVEIPPLPPHPRLLLTARDLPVIRERIARQPWAAEHFERLRGQARAWLGREIVLPSRGGQWYHYYSCPKHGARLRTEGPTRHVCPVDQEVFSGYPYDDVYLSTLHNQLAAGVRLLGLVYQLTGEEPLAGKAREILLAYAGRYESYPLHNTKGEAKIGGGKVGPQTLDEATWLITLVEGADCIWPTLSGAERDTVRDRLLLPATAVIRQHQLPIHNIQCWKNSAVGLTGLLLDNRELITEAIDGAYGFQQQMARGISPDGLWYEGAWGYHFYTVSALLHLTEGAFHCGIDLYGKAVKSLFDAPLDFAQPDLHLPPFNDSGTINLPGQAGAYEIAWARYRDPRQAALLQRSQRNTDAALLVGADLPGEPAPWKCQSRNFPASGYAILAQGTGRSATWLCLDYGPHGGGHGHPDKLGFVLYGLGQVLAPDPGTANYGVPIQAGWYRTSLAHNTLTIAETSQKPAEGTCVAFLADPTLGALMATAGPIAQGLAFRRTVALVDGCRLVFIDQVRAETEHTLDLAVHLAGKLDTLKGEPLALPNQPGYAYLREAAAQDPAFTKPITITLASGERLRCQMAADGPATWITATGAGAHTEDRVPVIIARRRAKTATLVWTLDWRPDPGEVQVEVLPLHISGGTTGPNEAVAAKITDAGGGAHYLVANPARSAVQNRQLQGDYSLAYFHYARTGRLLKKATAR